MEDAKSVITLCPRRGLTVVNDDRDAKCTLSLYICMYDVITLSIRVGLERQNRKAQECADVCVCLSIPIPNICNRLTLTAHEEGDKNMMPKL